MFLQCELYAFIIEYFFFSAGCNELFSLQLLAVHKRIPWKHKEHSLAFPKQKKRQTMFHIRQAWALGCFFSCGTIPRTPRAGIALGLCKYYKMGFDQTVF